MAYCSRHSAEFARLPQPFWSVKNWKKNLKMFVKNWKIYFYRRIYFEDWHGDVLGKCKSVADRTANPVCASVRLGQRKWDFDAGQDAKAKVGYRLVGRLCINEFVWKFKLKGKVEREVFFLNQLVVTLSFNVMLDPLGNWQGNVLHPLMSNEFKTTPVVPFFKLKLPWKINQNRFF